MPLVSLGTWQYNTTFVPSVIAMGLKAGFTHIDTALGYGNQPGVGAAFKARPACPPLPVLRLPILSLLNLLPFRARFFGKAF